jgi:hypothetical protein
MDGEPLYAVVTASQIQSLLSSTQVTSSDFNSVKALVRGEIDSWMVFKISSSGMPYLDENTLTMQMWKSATCLKITWSDAAYASRPVVIVAGIYGIGCPFFKIYTGS